MNRLRARHRGQRGSAAEHLSRDAATEQDPQGDPQESGQEVRRALRGDRRGQGAVQEVLRAVLKESQTGNSRGLMMS